MGSAAGICAFATAGKEPGDARRDSNFVPETGSQESFEAGAGLRPSDDRSVAIVLWPDAGADDALLDGGPLTLPTLHRRSREHSPSAPTLPARWPAIR